MEGEEDSEGWSHWILMGLNHWLDRLVAAVGCLGSPLSFHYRWRDDRAAWTRVRKPKRLQTVVHDSFLLAAIAAIGIAVLANEREQRYEHPVSPPPAPGEERLAWPLMRLRMVHRLGREGRAR